MKLGKIFRKAEEYSTDLRLEKEIDIDKLLKFYNKACEFKTNNEYDERRLKRSIEELEFYLNRLSKKEKLWDKFFEKYKL